MALGFCFGLIGGFSLSSAARYSRTGRRALCASVQSTSEPLTRSKRLASA